MGGTCYKYWEQKRCVQDFGGKLEVERRLGSPRLRWVDNIKVDIQEIGWGYGLE
jgi:hypothetical protein